MPFQSLPIRLDSAGNCSPWRNQGFWRFGLEEVYFSCHVTWTGRCALLPWGAFMYLLAEALGSGEVNLIGANRLLQEPWSLVSEGRMASRIKPVSSLCFGFLSFTRVCFQFFEDRMPDYSVLHRSKTVTPECNFRLSVNRNSFCGLNLKQPCKGLLTDYTKVFWGEGVKQVCIPKPLI